MAASLGLSKSAVKSPPLAHAKLQFLIQLEPVHRAFFSNVIDLFRRSDTRLGSTSIPGVFWPDVFVVSRFPWLGLVESLLWHSAGLASLWALSHVWLFRPPLVTHPTFTRSDVLYYSPAEYLPAIDTGRTSARSAQKGEPEFAKQPIISVPRESDNGSQTIITPPNVKLTHDVQVPNIVAWNQATPSIPLSATSPSRLAAPAPEVLPVAPPPEIANTNARRISGPESTIIAPAPEVAGLASRHPVSAPQVAIVAPPPEIESTLSKFGDININQSVVQPAPELPVPAQRVPVTAIGLSSNSVVPPPPSLPGNGNSGTARVRAGNVSGQVVPPPPMLGGTGTAAGTGRLIALGIHPAATPPPPDLAGKRRGTFAASPQGKAGASGTPEISASSSNASAESVGGTNGRGNGGSSLNPGSGIPAGIYVGEAPNKPTRSAVSGDLSSVGNGAGTATPRVIADTRPMRVTVTPHAAATSNAPPSEIERTVFRDRKSYSMILNMPNLNSAGGSWVIRFAEKAQSDAASDLTAPQATRKVDPGYPAELMRQNVHGTVILYAVIHRDGSVGDVRILSSVDERLDQFARAALSRWQFRPATRNGDAVELDAVVTIPFRAKNSF